MGAVWSGAMPVTEEMRRAVRNEECSAHGHNFDTIVQGMTGTPVRLVCTNCGRSWTVQAEGTS